MRRKRILAAVLAVLVGASAVPATNFAQTLPVEADREFSLQSAPDQEEWEKLKIVFPTGAAQKGSNDGTPMGNGRFGVKQDGLVEQEVFQLNHKGFWSGDPKLIEDLSSGKEEDEAGHASTPSERLEGFHQTQKLLKEAYSEGLTQEERLSKMYEVEEAAKEMWGAKYQATYLPMGNLLIDFPDLHEDQIQNYERMLDIDGATSNVTFEQDGVTYYRQAFTSYPDNVMVIRLWNDQDKEMNISAFMELPSEMKGKSERNQSWIDLEKNEVVMTGRAPVEKFKSVADQWYEDRGVTFEARAKVVADGADIKEEDGKLKVCGAKEIFLIFSCETTYKDPITDPEESGIDVTKCVREAIDRAAKQTYEELLTTHQEDYRSLFRRLWIDMDGEEILTNRGDATPWEYARHYQYSRYIMICSEREGTGNIPHGLRGIWNPSWNPPNENAYFLNESVQKFHNIVGPGNLTDTASPYYEWMGYLANPKTGGKTAKESFGVENAWCVGHSTDVWCKTDLYGENTDWGNWNGGGIWLMNDLYTAYDFTQDLSFLETYYPVLEGAARFALENMIQVDGTQGELRDYWVVAPAQSPEHWYKTNGAKISGVDIATACDTQLYLNLFHIMELAAKELEDAGLGSLTDQELLEKVKTRKEQMMPLEMFLDENGRMKEWYNEYETGETWHRHASHLLGLILGYTGISEVTTPEIFEAEKKELQRLTQDGGGMHPDPAMMFVAAGMPSTGMTKFTRGLIGTETDESQMGGEWGNIASAPIGAAIGEALLDSRNGVLDILDNLPEEWKSGKISGICARGGYQLSIEWKDGSLVKCVIDSPTGETPLVRYQGKGICLATDERFVVNRAKVSLEELVREAKEKLGQTYYTEASRQTLQERLETENYDQISDALLALVPDGIEVRVTADQSVLTQEGEKVQLSAACEEEDPEFYWTITDADGSETEAATIDQEGVVTARRSGTVIARAMLKDGSCSTGSMELTIELPTEEYDDRDEGIIYEGTWVTYDGQPAHRNGTVTYTTTAGSFASFTFHGTGIEFITTAGGHTGTVDIKIDGQTVAENLYLNRDSFGGQGGFQFQAFEADGLPRGEHTIEVIAKETDGVQKQVDIDAFIVHRAMDIVTEKLPEGTVNKPYRAVLQGSGANPVSWNIEGTLPEGLSLEDNVITGIPVKAGSYTFTVKASNGADPDVAKEFTILVRDLPLEEGSLQALEEMIQMVQEKLEQGYSQDITQSIQALLEEARQDCSDPLLTQDEADALLEKLQEAYKKLQELDGQKEQNQEPADTPEGDASQKPESDARQPAQTTPQAQTSQQKTEWKKGSQFRAGKLYYRVLSKKHVAVAKPVRKTYTSLVIPATVKKNGRTYQVTEIGSGAFRGNRKLRKITIGKNVRKIGEKAFYGDRKLEKIRIKSVKLKKAYKDSLKGIAKKAVIDVPNQKVKSYRKMLFLKKSRKTVR